LPAHISTHFKNSAKKRKMVIFLQLIWLFISIHQIHWRLFHIHFAVAVTFNRS
jgi:hypothetical protein